MEENKTSTWEEYRKRTHVIGREMCIRDSNPDVARVSSNGRITGLKPGKTVVKAVVRLQNGRSKLIRMTVIVNEKK